MRQHPRPANYKPLERCIVSCFSLAFCLFLFLTHGHAQFLEGKDPDSLKTIVRQSSLSDSSKLDAMMYLAKEYAWSEPDTARTYIAAAMKIATALHDTNKEAWLGLYLGYCHIVKGNYEEAIRSLENTLALCNHSPDKQLEAETYATIGGSYEFLGNYKLSLQNHEISLKLHMALKDQAKTARDYNNIAQVYKRLGNWPVSLSFYFKALQLYEQLNYKRGLTSTFLNMGEVYQLMKDYDRALQYLRKAKSVHSNLAAKGTIGDVYQVLCKTFYLMDQLDSALYYQRKSLTLFEEVGEIIGIAVNHSHHAFIQVKKNNMREALEHSLYALQLQKKIGDKAGSATSLCLIADIYDSLRQYKLAGKFALQALQLSDSAGLLQHKSDALRRLISLLRRQRDFEKAFYFQQQLQTVRDSLLNEERTRQISNTEAQYENDKKEQEIHSLQQQSQIQALELRQQTLWKRAVTIGLIFALLFLLVLYNRFRVKQRSNKLLAQRNELIEQKEADLSKLLQEKEILFKEMHHRVKNNLQTISSLLNLQSRVTKDERVIAAMKEGQGRIKSMALIHQKLYAHEEITSIGFLEYTRELIDYLFRTYHHPQKNIRYHLEPFDLRLDVDTAIPLGLILNELISNSLKYAFNDVSEGMVHVSIKEMDGSGLLRLRVSDNGKGMPDNFDYEQSSSIGLRLVRSLSRQLQAELTMVNSSGLSCSIDFKMS